MEQLIELARSYNKTGQKWHHHFLPPKCHYNKEDNFLVVLENDDNQEIHIATVKAKPMNELRELEKLFFQK